MASLRQVLSLSALLGLAAAAPTQLSRKLSKRTALPDYALTYAPWTYIQSEEQWFPSDIKTHLENCIPEVNYNKIGSAGSVTLNTLNSYNSSVYLTSKDDAESSDSYDWLMSDYGIPNDNGYSAAPGTIIAVEKNSTTTDVFYFHFYSYNYGGKVLDINFDDHVGDWEHTMIRFVNEEPYALYVSEHGAGSAYYWDVLTFNGQRPITYVAHGGHAEYVTSGSQEYTIALGLIEDTTDQGFPWDMTQNYRGYWYDTSSGTFSKAGGADIGATEMASEDATWLLWEGHWGDEQYKDTFLSPQYCLGSECHYTSGPTGPVDKNLGRTAMCQTESDCTIYDDINDITVQD